jgi:hypothetical protein
MKKNHDGFKHISPTKYQRERPQILHKKFAKKRLRKSAKRRNVKRHIQALRNHVESSIHTKEVHTRSSLPPDHPSLSQDLTTLSC